MVRPPPRAPPPRQKTLPESALFPQVRTSCIGVENGKKAQQVLPVHQCGGRRICPQVPGDPPDRKIRKSGHGRDGHVRFFLPAAFRQRKLCRDTACLPRLQRRSAAGALGRTPFPDRLKGHAAAFSRSPALRGPFGEKETKESHRPAGCHRIDGEEDPSLRRRLRYRQQGQWPPVSHCFFRSRFPGYRRPGPRPHRRRGRPWRNDGYGAA